MSNKGTDSAAGFIILAVLAVAILVEGLKWIFGILFLLAKYVVLPGAALFLIFWSCYWLGLRVYHAVNPNAKREYLERKAREKAQKAKRKEREEARHRAQVARNKAKASARAKRKEREVRALIEQREYARRKKEEHRDADQQETPYTYEIGRHGNESLAIRYGIANQEKKVKEYWYFAKGGERKRNPERDSVFYEPAKTIRLQKTERVGKDLYNVLLTEFRDRKARAVIEVGTEYVKTFYPLDDSWFQRHSELENTLKGNSSFNLKELATFHIQKAVK